MEKARTKKYTNGEVTVVWKPETCIHSKICWTSLSTVFNPRNRPWIEINGATTEDIVNQVKKCPSGALSYYMNNDMEGNTEVKTDTIIEAAPNGPLMVYGTIKIKDSEGNEIIKHKTTAFCRCGGSSNKPYCDGTHRNNGFIG